MFPVRVVSFSITFACLGSLMYEYKYAFVKRYHPLPAESFLDLSLKTPKLVFMFPASAAHFPVFIFKQALYMVRATALPTLLAPALHYLSL